jgi:hypothetical protein
VEADPSQQPGGPAADGQVNLGISQTDLAGLLKGGMIVLSQPGQAGDRDAVVVLVNGEGYGPLDQPLDLGRDGLLLGESSGHMRTLAHSPDSPAPRSADKQMQSQEFAVGAGHRRTHPYGDELWPATGNVPVKCLDLPGGLVKDQPGSAIGTPVANATTGWVAQASVVAWFQDRAREEAVRFLSEPARWRALVIAAALLSVTGLVTTSAGAAVNDNVNASTTDGCGVANFIDDGPGAPGGGNNDDYVVIHDYCADGHGVMAYVEVDDSGYWFHQYNGNGLSGAPVVWDPFLRGNVKAGQKVELEVCLVDGISDPTGSRCGEASRRSADG